MFNGLRLHRRAGALVGLLVALLLATMLPQQFVAAEDEYVLIEARVLAQRHDDGRVEVVLEVRRDGDRWREQISPTYRFLPDPAPIGVWWNSTPPLRVPGVPGQFGIIARRTQGGHVELGLQRVTGVHWGERLLPRLRQLGTPRYGPVGIRTSPIELVDEGPTVCYLGLVVSAGERCRIAETRSHFAVRTDGVAIYPPSWSRRGSDSQPSLVDPDRFRSYLRVHVPAGVPAPSDSAKSLAVERIRDGAYLIIRTAYDLLQPANGADCVEGLLVPFGHYCGLPVTTGGKVWFVVYPHGPAHLSIPNDELSWVSEADMHVDTGPVGYPPHYRLDAAREQTGWRITTIASPELRSLPFVTRSVGDCFPGLILRLGQHCTDPTSPGVYSVSPDGGLAWLDGSIHYEPRSQNWAHPNGGSNGFFPVGGGAWLTTGIGSHPDNPEKIGLCIVGFVLHPGQVCFQTAGMWFTVFPNGLGYIADEVDFERVEVVGREVRYGSGWVARYDFTAVRQNDGSFRITHMRERWPQAEAQVRRELGDCRPGLILDLGDRCRYADGLAQLVMIEDGRLHFGGVGAQLREGAFSVDPWGLGRAVVFQWERLSNDRRILIAVGDNTPHSIGDCSLDLVVKPGQSCSSGPGLPDFYVFHDAALYAAVATSLDLDVSQADMGLRLRAERQPDRSYIIRELASRS